VRIFQPSDRRRRSRGADRLRVGVVLVVLVFLEFYLRPSLVESPHGMPDFLILMLLLLAIREEPGAGALTGFAIGLVTDVLTPAHFGAGILANVLVGWGAAYGRGIFFADNLLVNAALFFIGTWVRNVLMLLFSGTALHLLPAEILLWSPLQALSTAVVGVVVVVVFRDWLAIRIDS
jgi:rod shape-determining protein MreD